VQENSELYRIILTTLDKNCIFTGRLGIHRKNEGKQPKIKGVDVKKIPVVL
jgi:hypothetical protein